MTHKELVFKFIQENQPVSRKKVLEHFHAWNSKTVYRHIKGLTDDKRVFVTSSKELTTAPVDSQWQLHPALIQFQDVTPITHAYATRNPKLKELTLSLIEEKGPVLAEVLINLIILSNLVANGFELSQAYTPNESLSEADLEKYFKDLKDLLS